MLRRSVSTASATPGYWTLTATRRPSWVTARWTWPIEAAANASRSNSAKWSPSGPPSSSRSSFSMRLKGSGGTSSRSEASVRLNSSRSASGMAVNSTVERTCPIFIAAPRIWPSCSTSSRASAVARSPVAASAFSGERTRLAARVPAQRRLWPATRPPTRPVRPRRELEGGLGSSGTAGELRTGEVPRTILAAWRCTSSRAPAQWRAWLAAHHETATEVEVGFRRKATGLPTLTWSESVDEALCFGWIDGVRRGIDETSYRIRFTPRKARSTWSKVNIAKVAELSRQGRMEPAGDAAFARRTEDNSGVYSFERDRPAELPPEYEARLRADQAAWADWSARPPGYRRTATHWVTSAKREETRERRLATLVECSREGRKVPPLV